KADRIDGRREEVLGRIAAIAANEHVSLEYGAREIRGQRAPGVSEGAVPAHPVLVEARDVIGEDEPALGLPLGDNHGRDDGAAALQGRIGRASCREGEEDVRLAGQSKVNNYRT